MYENITWELVIDRREKLHELHISLINAITVIEWKIND